MWKFYISCRISDIITISNFMRSNGVHQRKREVMWNVLSKTQSSTGYIKCSFLSFIFYFYFIFKYEYVSVLIHLESMLHEYRYGYHNRYDIEYSNTIIFNIIWISILQYDTDTEPYMKYRNNIALNGWTIGFTSGDPNQLTLNFTNLHLGVGSWFESPKKATHKWVGPCPCPCPPGAWGDTDS